MAPYMKRDITELKIPSDRRASHIHGNSSMTEYMGVGLAV